MYIRCIYVAEIFAVRVPKEVREKMRRFREVNWSEVVREAILSKLRELEELERMRRAAEAMDRIREEMLRSYGPSDYDSADEIRRWRERR